MSYAAILAQIKTDLESVTNIGKVYDSVRWSIYEDSFLENFIETISGQDQVITWLITRNNVVSQFGPAQNALGTRIHVPLKQELVKHDIMIDGFMSFTDNSTEVDFQTLIDSIMADYRNIATFSNTAFIRGPINIKIEMASFGEVLCHHALITFYVTEFNNINLT